MVGLLSKCPFSARWHYPICWYILRFLCLNRVWLSHTPFHGLVYVTNLEPYVFPVYFNRSCQLNLLNITWYTFNCLCTLHCIPLTFIMYTLHHNHVIVQIPLSAEPTLNLATRSQPCQPNWPPPSKRLNVKSLEVFNFSFQTGKRRWCLTTEYLSSS